MVSLKSIYQNFEFQYWTLKKSFKYNTTIKITYLIIKEHKRKMKYMIKNNYSEHPFQLLNGLNKIIYNWVFKNSISDYYLDIWSELDIYVYKLLWKWAKRRHPRRPNTWIYNKYWKFFSGIWRFFTRNPTTGEIQILRSHYMSKRKIYRLPNFVNSFSTLNENKIEIFYFKRLINTFSGIVRILWKKQRGKCFICQHILTVKSYNNLKIYRIKKDGTNILSYVILHSYCYFII